MRMKFQGERKEQRWARGLQAVAALVPGRVREEGDRSHGPQEERLPSRDKCC